MKEDEVNKWITDKAPLSTVRIKQFGDKFILTTKTMYGTFSMKFWRKEINSQFNIKISKHL